MLQTTKIIYVAKKLNSDSILNSKEKESIVTMIKNFFIKKHKLRYKIHTTISLVEETGKIPVIAWLTPEEYVLLQETLLNKTGRYWEMDKFISFIVNWFNYIYNQKNITYSPPPISFNNNRFIRLAKFYERFQKYMRKDKLTTNKLDE